MTMESFVCWTAASVDATVVVDAVNASPAVFLATHRPSQLLRRDFKASQGGKLIDEEQLLKEFLAPNPGLLFVPIVGESGTGKSHLVRWLNLRVPADPQRRVVYIPKYGTNLRNVIELILADMRGEAVDELRRELDKAVDSLDEAGAPSRLLNEIAASIEDRSREPRPTPPPADDEYREFLEVELPKLLLDNVFRTRLLEPHGVIDRLVHETLKGKPDEDKSEPFAFTADDLPLTAVDVTKAGADVQSLFRQLIGSEPLKQVAVDLLNENLGPAIRKLFGMGGTRLFDVLLSVRRELLAQDTELVLLIEDFTILQGIQRELLDAITEAPTREGRQVLCSIRVAMAVTTGYFATLAETFSTRAEFAGHVYSLDVPRTREGRGVDREDIADFVGGYLNASRLGQAELESALENAGDDRATHRRWVPNACHECPHQDTCHEAFGTTRDGLGLYPFNAAALDRAVDSRSPANFDPRRILGTVVRYTLDQHRVDIERGEFPGTSFLQHFAAAHLQPLAAEVVEDIRAADPIDADRRVTLLTFWGGRPNKIVNLEPGVHEAFALPPVGDAELHRPRRESAPAPTTGPDAQTENLPGALQRRLDAIDQWASGTTQLDQALAGDLRRILHAAILDHIDWNAELLDPTDEAVGRTGQYFRLASIRIENAMGGGNLPATAVAIQVPVSATSATLLQALLLNEHLGNWRFDRGDERLRQYLARLDDWGTQVTTTVRRGGPGDSDWDPVAGAVELLLLTARIADLPGSHSKLNSDLVSAIFADAPASAPRRGNAWDRLVDTSIGDVRRKVRDNLLARVGARQGRGRPHAIDATALTPAITSFKRTWHLTEPPVDAPKDYKRLYTDLSSRLEEAVNDELSRLSAWHESVTSWLPDDMQAAEITDEFARAAQAAITAGVFDPKRLRDAFEETSRAFRRTKLTTVGEIGELLADGSDRSEGKLLSDLALDRQKSMTEISRFVEQSREIVAGTTQRAQQQLDTYADDGGENLIDPLKDQLIQLRAVFEDDRA